MVRKLVTLVLIGGALAVAACNTVRGAAADVNSVANCTQKRRQQLEQARGKLDAFAKANPFGAKLGAVLSSDISHFDVPDMTEVLEEAWELVTSILEGWEDEARHQLPTYEAGTWGPEEADKLIADDRRTWRRL